jgi:hypothetical protein
MVNASAFEGFRRVLRHRKMTQEIKKLRMRRPTTTPPMMAPILIFFDLAPVVIAVDDAEDDERGGMEEEVPREAAQGCNVSEWQVLVIAKKWLMLTVVHEVVKPDRSLNRIGCWIDLGHGDNECAKVKHGISKNIRAIQSDTQTYCCPSEIGPESQLSGEEVTFV